LPVVIHAALPTGASVLHKTNFSKISFKVIVTVCKNYLWSYKNFAVLRMTTLFINISVTVPSLVTYSRNRAAAIGYYSNL